MIQIDKEKVSKALNDAYLEAGDNAYYGTGFRDGIKFALAEVEKLNIGTVMPRLFGVATKLSEQGRQSLDIDDRTFIDAFLPCNVYETDVIAECDGSNLLWLEDSPKKKEFYINKMFLSINEA